MENIDVENYIRQGQESEYVDFKEKLYTNLSQSDLAKDIAAFANGVSKGDKYIIMGIDDKKRNVIGIPYEQEFDSSSIENHIVERIEPRIMVKCGECEVENKRIAYIKIPETNDNPPYIIKRDSGKSIRQGDIYIRIGTCNRKATREDIDAMYNINLKINIKIYEQYVAIIPGEKDLGEAKIDIELINPTNNPILINGGCVILSNEFDTIERKAMSFGEDRMLEEKPLLLKANSREKKTLQFSFSSDDCLRLRFEDTVTLQYNPYIKIDLFDTDGNSYIDEMESVSLYAKGNILHKIKLLYREFRMALKLNEKKMIKAVSSNDNETLEYVLSSLKCNLTFVQKGYVLGHPEYPEYDIMRNVILAAKANGNDEAIEILYEHLLPNNFVEFALTGVEE